MFGIVQFRNVFETVTQARHYVKCFSGAKVLRVKDYLNPCVADENSNCFILYTGANHLNSGSNSENQKISATFCKSLISKKREV